MMFEKGINRGGITHISKRYVEANNKYISDCDSTKPSKFIQYLDANNLYSCTMSQRLPTHGFKWLKDLTVESTKKYLIKNQKITVTYLKLILDIQRNSGSHIMTIP